MVCPGPMPPPSGRARRAVPVRRVRGRGGGRGVRACVAACPLDALAFDDRDAMVSRAQRARSGSARARSGQRFSAQWQASRAPHHVVQVMKHGAAGSMHEALASTGEVEWLDAAKMAIPTCVRGRPRPCRCGRRGGVGLRASASSALPRPRRLPLVATFNPFSLTTRALKAGRAPMAMREVVERPLFRPPCAAATPCVPGSATGRRRGCCSGRRTGGGVPLVQR